MRAAGCEQPLQPDQNRDDPENGEHQTAAGGTAAFDRMIGGTPLQPVPQQRDADQNADHFIMEQMRPAGDVDDDIIAARHERDHADDPSEGGEFARAARQVVADLGTLPKQRNGEQEPAQYIGQIEQ